MGPDKPILQPRCRAIWFPGRVQSSGPPPQAFSAAARVTRNANYHRQTQKLKETAVREL